MLTLESGQLFYHGSYIAIEKMDLAHCRPFKDFGKGFYVTTSKNQAEEFARLSCRKKQQTTQDEGYLRPYVSSYTLNECTHLLFHAFESADIEWLHFVAGNRRNELTDEFKHFQNMDVIAGKIANDQTARTLQLYISGAYGFPGSAEADHIAIDTLLPNRLENQYCFKTQAAVDCLVYRESYECTG